jgi:hypothetical protein
VDFAKSRGRESSERQEFVTSRTSGRCDETWLTPSISCNSEINRLGHLICRATERWLD